MLEIKTKSLNKQVFKDERCLRRCIAAVKTRPARTFIRGIQLDGHYQPQLCFTEQSKRLSSPRSRDRIKGMSDATSGPRESVQESLQLFFFAKQSKRLFSPANTGRCKGMANTNSCPWETLIKALARLALPERSASAFYWLSGKIATVLHNSQALQVETS